MQQKCNYLSKLEMGLLMRTLINIDNIGMLLIL